MKHVIIGSGAAGINAAKTIRKQPGQDEIVIISADEAVYSRCMLHHFISGKRKVAELSFIPDGFFEQNRIRFCSGITVTGIDTAQKYVQFNGGGESYDRLLIACGAESLFPPIAGLSGTKNIFGLRNLADARAIRSNAEQTNQIIIIGAGLVGLDAAYGLLKMGKTPLIVDQESSILSANLDAHAAATYQKKFAEAGCLFRLGNKVNAILRDTSGQVKAIALDNGEHLTCDLLIVATGVHPAIGFLASSGIAYDYGITVDSYLKTNIDGIYAAGDITGLSESWPNAMLQGEIAALNMLGIAKEYNDTFAVKNTVHFFGIPSLSVGRFTPIVGDDQKYREDRNRYQKVIIQDGIPVGVILQGDISRSGFWQYLIKNKIDITNIPKSIWDISFADSYSIDANGEYQWKTG